MPLLWGTFALTGLSTSPVVAVWGRVRRWW